MLALPRTSPRVAASSKAWNSASTFAGKFADDGTLSSERKA